MKSSFEWKKDIDEKVANKRVLIAKRNARMKSISGMSLAIMICVCCSIAVVRFSSVNNPIVGNGDESPITTGIDSQTESKLDLTTVYPKVEGIDSSDVYMYNTELPSFTGVTYTEVCIPTTEKESPKDVADPSYSEPVYTGGEPDWYPPDWEPSSPSTTGIEFVTTAPIAPHGSFRFAKPIINRAFPEMLNYPDASENRLTFAEVLRYYGLSDFNVSPSLRTDADYRISFADEYVFLVDEFDPNARIVLRDDITVNYVSDIPEVYYSLSIGLVRPPYDWLFTTENNSDLVYRDVTVRCGYLNASGISAELIVADYEYNGIKFRFSGHNVTEKEYLSCLYTVIDCLFRK